MVRAALGLVPGPGWEGKAGRSLKFDPPNTEGYSAASMATSQPLGNPASHAPSRKRQDPVTPRSSWCSQEWPKSGMRSQGLIRYLVRSMSPLSFPGAALRTRGASLCLCPWPPLGREPHLGHEGFLLLVPLGFPPHELSLCFGFSAQQRSTQLNKKRAIPNQVTAHPCTLRGPQLHPRGWEGTKGPPSPAMAPGS